MKRIIFLLLGACLCACGRYGCGVPAGYEPLLDAALAGCPRADSLRNLLRQTPREQREGMAFLIAHMPRGDRDTMRLDLLREADAIAREELSKAGLDRDIWQCPVVLLADVHSVGVQGDERTYGSPIVLRPVSSEDAMTADWSRVPYDVLATISTRITNECRQINRVVLDCTSKPPATIEWE